jgi:hypothetical protein
MGRSGTLVCIAREAVRLKTLLLLCLMIGCANTSEANKLETELVMLRTDWFYYKLGTAPIGSSAATRALEGRIDVRIDKAIEKARRLAGSSD